MTTGPVTRIMVMGPPGSGKSTLARMLGERLGLPVWHTDMFFHDPGWAPRPTEALIADLTALAAKPAWVIDGNCANARYGSGIGDRLARADRIIWLDLPRRLTIPRVLWRIAKYRGEIRPDSAAGCPERFDWGFLVHCWRWRRTVRPNIVGVLTGLEDRVIRYVRSPTPDQVVEDLGDASVHGHRLRSGGTE